MAYSGYSGEIPSWQMGYTRDTDVDIPNLTSLLKGRSPGPVRRKAFLGKIRRKQDVALGVCLGAAGRFCRVVVKGPCTAKSTPKSGKGVI